MEPTLGSQRVRHIGLRPGATATIVLGPGPDPPRGQRRYRL